jgi:hypothetical protein
VSVNRSRWLRLGLLWAAVAGILSALYFSGTTAHHRYEDPDGWGLNQDRYIGESLAGEVMEGERYRYVGVRRQFEGDPGPRIFAVAAILPIAVLITIQLLRSKPDPTGVPPLPPPPPEQS